MPIVTALLVLALAACSTGRSAEPSPTGGPSISALPPSAGPSTSGPVGPANTSTASTCDIFDTLRQVDELLAGETYEAHFLTIADRMSISIWLMDRAIDPAATDAGLAAANREAISKGLAISYRVVARIPCARRVFEVVNPMIVDSRYQGWYIDFIPVQAFTDLVDPTTDQLIEAADRAGVPPKGRTQPPAYPTTARPASPCSWPLARAGIAALQGSAMRNVAAYLIVDGGQVSGGQPSDRGDVNVEVQWDVSELAETEDAVTLQRLGRVAGELACLVPRVGELEFFVVDPVGELVVYARVPGWLIRPGGLPITRGSIYLRHTPSRVLR